MACINMYNPEAAHQGGGAGGGGPGLMSPRISFSNDFVLDQGSSGSGSIKHETRPTRPLCPPDPSAPDFEFSAGQSHLCPAPMIAADEAFFKGRLVPVPLRDSLQRVTLRDELSGDGDEDGSGRGASSRTSYVRWRELLGLRKAAVPTTTATPPMSARRLVDDMLAGCGGDGQDVAPTGCYNGATVRAGAEQKQEGRRTTEGAAARQRNVEIGA